MVEPVRPIPFDLPRPDGGYRCAAELHGKPVPPRLWHVEGFIPAKTVTTLSGDGGTGKSLAALQLAVATALGRTWLGQPVTPGRALYVSAEDDHDELHRRLVDIARAEDIALADLDALTIRSLAGHDALMGVATGPGGTLAPTPLFGDLSRWVKDHEPTLIVLDTLADLFGGDEINRAHARQFISMLRGLALDNDCTVLLLAHPSLSGMSRGDGNSGSTGWNNSVRSRLYLRRVRGDAGDEPDPDLRQLEVVKANYAGIGAVLNVRWRDGVFEPEQLSGGHLDRMAASAKAERVFQKLLRQFSAEGRYVSHQPGPTYAPSIFARHPDAEGCQKRAFESAMNAAFGKGAIHVASHGRGAKARSHIAEGAPDAA